MLATALALALQTGNMLPQSSRASTLVADCKTYIALVDNTRKIPYDEFFDAGICLGFVKGLSAGMRSQKDACTQDANLTTQVRVFIKFMEDNPKMMDEPDTYALAYALHFAYPCPAK